MKRILIIICIFPLFISAQANAFEIDGIWYSIGNSNNATVSSYDTNCPGDIIIPSQVNYDDKSYIVTSIGVSAFRNCDKLTSITIPNSVNNIEEWAFGGCKNLTSITIQNGVTSIRNYAFYECSALTSVIIPNSVTFIGKGAFENCRCLKSVDLPNSIINIGEWAFANCENLISFIIPNSVTIIEDYTFQNCISLTSISIPNSVTSFGIDAFRCCESLTSITIPNSVTTIGRSAFCASGLMSIDIPNSVSNIGQGAFSECNGLTSITIPNSVITIEDYAFNYCKNLTSVDIPKSVTYIGNGAFASCDNLISVSSAIEAPFVISNTVFPNKTYTNGQLIVPRGKKTYYQSTDGWNLFQNIIEAGGVANYTLSIKAIGNGVVTYGNNSINNQTKEFTLDEGTSATITFTPDNGYRIMSVKVNSTDVTSSVSNNSYTISSISANTTVEVEFEAIPIPTYTLSVTATGNGTATYDGTTAKNNTQSYTLNEGTSATITFSPDNGYIIKSVKVNSSDVTSSVLNNSYTISSISANTTVEVEFEAIPVTTYTLSITASGNGSASYSGTTAKNNTKTFTLNEGSSATITFAPDNGYRIKSVKVNSTDVTSRVSNNSYTISSISANTTVEVEFEAIPIPTYTLSVKATGNGSATYDGTTAYNNTKSFTLNEGTSATITITPDNGYRIKSVKVNSTDVTSSVSNNQYTVSNIKANTTVEVEFEAIPVVVTTYTLTIKATGNGSATYGGTTAKNNTQTFTLNDGTSATITFTPDNGYRVKSVKVNSTDVTSSVSNNQYTVSNIKANTTVEVEFEAIPANTYILKYVVDGEAYKTYELKEGDAITPEPNPQKDGYSFSGWSEIPATMPAEDVTITGTFTKNEPEITTYVLSVKAMGSGSASFDGTTIVNNTQTFTVNEGASITVTFSPDNGYRIKSVKVNGTDVTSNVSYSQYTVNNINTDTTVEVEFEAIPVNTYTLKYVVDGETYKTFELEEGAVITPEAEPTKEGYAFSGWSEIPATMPAEDVTITGTFTKNEPEEQTYTLTIGALGNGYISYNNIPVQNDTQSFSIEAGVLAIVTIHPDEGYQNKKVTINGLELADLSTMSFTIDAMDEDVTIEVEFEQMDSRMTINGVNYEVVSFSDHTMVVADGDYGQTLEVPATVNKGNDTWTVMGLKNGALDQNENLAAVIWDPSAVFNARVSNPNLLLYVKDKAYASYGVNNVIVNGTAESIELTDASSGNDFYCPRAFKAKKISYSHRYNMETGLGDSKGWETIVLPFDVQKYTSPKGEIVPFTKWTKSDNKKPFWLFELTASGYKDVEGIKANTPYIISMPNNPQYQADYVIIGLVTFSAENAEVKASDEMQSANYQDRTFVPNYTNKAGEDYLVLNVNNYYVTNPGTDIDGSKFIKGLRAVHPFEAYMTTTSNTRSIDVMDGMTTAIRDIVMTAEGKDIIKVYDTRGILVKTMKAGDDLRKGLAAGVYIVNGKKMIIK